MEGFKASAVYQIYTKSFQDSNGDGLGDIRGVISRLDYIKEQGADYIWLTPFFKSPLNDNGYDVSDYLSVDPVFGTMEDVEELIAQAEARGIGCMFDMVFNHTSTEHAWFRKALAGDPEYMDYYIFRDGEPDVPPTNWESKFGGSAWEYVPHLKKWYLHLFDVTQADLNWDNPKVREELKNVIRFWKNKGVKGFRFDVVNLISKPEAFENDYAGDGRRFYTDGPHVHEYLQELTRDTGIASMVTVGEMSSTSLENCIRYSRPEDKELTMCFNFHHLKVDYKDGDKWKLKEPDLGELKRLFTEWQEGMEKAGGWNAVFWCNHDQPRAVSRFGDDRKYWKESAKTLAIVAHMFRGTPYVYQGEELGMTNPRYSDISQYRDVESINYYKILQERGASKEEALAVLGERSRDNGRTPMQWKAGPNAGFTDGEPWIGIPENHSYINVEEENKDEDSILSCYKKLIRLRKEYRVIAEGDIGFIYRDHPQVLAYRRRTEEEELIVLANMTGREAALAPAFDAGGWELLTASWKEAPAQAEGEIRMLRPFESQVWRKSR
ncbi:MAG TPA: alpha,alpha-phosphotrehalase [Candidatus Enterocloster excrementipullorum]|uniref:Alpha,alpha-phosphotrehalase n=1 Tax=Candidatus Enterocloster excrementipullorum TaxID=2838559 RepID=A0A9D2N188_9FIRM|nr:alpha,alpha-phosphotrehalase [Candidatus Enterocloster excrementipullorum]